MSIIKNMLVLTGCYLYGTLSVYWIIPGNANTMHYLSTLGLTLLALTIHIYQRPFTNTLPEGSRWLYAFFLSLVMIIGSIAMWEIMEYYLPHEEGWISVAAGLITAFTFGMLFKEYLIACDIAYGGIVPELPLEGDNTVQEDDYLTDVMKKKYFKRMQKLFR